MPVFLPGGFRGFGGISSLVSNFTARASRSVVDRDELHDDWSTSQSIANRDRRLKSRETSRSHPIPMRDRFSRFSKWQVGIPPFQQIPSEAGPLAAVDTPAAEHGV